MKGQIVGRKKLVWRERLASVLWIGLWSRLWGSAVLSHQLFVTVQDIAHQALLSMGFSSQEYWSGLLCPPPGDPPDPGIEPISHDSCIGRLVRYH